VLPRTTIVKDFAGNVIDVNQLCSSPAGRLQPLDQWAASRAQRLARCMSIAPMGTSLRSAVVGTFGLRRKRAALWLGRRAKLLRNDSVVSTASIVSPFWRCEKSTHEWGRSIFLAAVVGVTYFLVARGCLFLLTDGVAVFWPAAGIASGTLIVFGPRARFSVVLGVAAATLGANLMGDRDLWSSLFFLAANCVEAVLVAGLIERVFGSAFQLDQMKQVIGLFVATCAATMISGALGTLGFVLFYGPASPVWLTWFHWVASDWLGNITVGPLALGLTALILNPPAKREIIEGSAAVGIIVLVCGLVVFLPNQPWTREIALASFCPLVVWTAARVPPAFTSFVTFVWCFTIVWTTTFGIGIFGGPSLPLEERIVSSQATLLATSFGALILAALFNERKSHEAAILDREVRLEEALQVGKVLAFEWDRHSDVVQLTPNAGEILGLTRNGNFTGTELLDRVHPEDRASILTVRSGQGGTPQSVTFRFQRPDGNGEVWLERRAAISESGGARSARVDGLIVDVTERRRFEGELDKARRAAEFANQTKSNFLAAASHDLRQPLQTMKLLQYLLYDCTIDAEARLLLKTQGRCLDSMADILTTLLDLNRLDSGDTEVRKSNFKLKELLEPLMAEFLPLVHEKGLDLRVVHSEAVVYTDKGLVSGIIRNLLSNAFRYTDQGRILLGCRRCGDNIRIELWDSGIGISESELPHIFNEYYTGQNSADRGGCGLGLTIVRRLGEILQHAVDVRSTPGKGSVFSVEVARGHPQSAEAPPPLLRADHRGGKPLPDRVLLIEDEACVRSALVKVLSGSGVDLLAAATSDAALDLISRSKLPPDLVICDYNLRGSRNGMETVKSIRQLLRSEVPAIVVTGDTRAKIMDRMTASGVAVLTKPFRSQDLFAMMARLHGTETLRADACGPGVYVQCTT
jgi:signal transduction histidine kinase/CheY-like chemotaxis protein